MDVEKTIEFLLSNQARMASDLQQLTGSVGHLSGRVGQLIGTVDGLAQVQARQLDMMGTMIGAVDKLTQEVREFKEATDERSRRLESYQERTEINLNALIKIVDDLIRRDGGHQQQ